MKQPQVCSFSKHLQFIASILFFVSFWAPSVLEAQVPSTATPSYYYDRETAYLINFAIDKTNGGIYTATSSSGAIVDLSGLLLWNGTAPSGTMSSVKTTSAQAVGILYFIREYQRTKEVGITDVNAQITATGDKVTTPLEFLTKWAKNLADFAIGGEKFKMSPSAQSAMGGNANKLYYYGKTDANGSNGTPDGTGGAGTPESLLPWALSELALVMKDAGVSSTVYQPYIDEAVKWWVWRKNTATATSFGWGQNTQYGAGRDVYYGALGLTLYELTNTAEYKTGPGNMADGKPLGATPYMYAALGSAGSNANLGNPPSYAIQDGAYVAGFARGICYAKSEQRPALGLTAYSDRQPWQEFGFGPLYERGNSYPVYDINSPTELTSLGETTSGAFQHFKGRELFAGVMRTLWFNYSFDVNGGLFYASNGSNPNWPNDFTTATSGAMAKEYWDFCNTQFWDNTTGVAAWVENTDAPKYKPCFSGGVEVPIADWKAPTINGKSDNWTAGNNATVSITGVVDSNWNYLTWKFDNSGVSLVEVVYSKDNGATWTTLPASLVSGSNYSAVIPAADVTAAHTAGFHLYYFIRAKDAYANYSVNPVGAQVVLSETGILTAAGAATAIDKSLACKILNPNPCAKITMSPIPLPEGKVGEPYSIQIVATGGTSPYNYIWRAGTTGTLPDGLSISTSGLVSGTPITSGSYEVKILVEDNNACSDSLDPAILTIIPCGDTFRICAGQTLTLTAATGTTNIQWKKDGNDLVGETNLSLLVSTVGIYTFTGNDANGCSGGLCCPIVVLDSTCCIVPTITSTVADTATCTNGVTNNDAKIAVRGITQMTKYVYGTNGTTDLYYANATASTADSIKLTNLTAPSVATTYTFRIYGIDSTCYNDTMVVLNPSVCPPCSIVATFTQNVCNNNSTTAIATDDYFTVTVSAVSATNGGTSGKYEVLLNGTVLNAGGTTYGTSVTVGTTTTFKSDGTTTYQLKVRDLDIPTCETNIFTTSASAACSIIPCKPQICLPVAVMRVN